MARPFYGRYLIQLLFALLALVDTRCCHGWSASLRPCSRSPFAATCRSGSRHQYSNLCRTTTTRSACRLYAQPLAEGYQAFAEQVIQQVGADFGCRAESATVTDNHDDAASYLSIEWKAGRIIVTVHGPVYVSTIPSSDDEEDDLDLDSEEGDVQDDEEEEEETSDDDSANGVTDERGVDLTALARAINAAFDDGDEGRGTSIAQVHAIEVTTPGAPQELTGNIMFRSYRGFDVICHQQDAKSNKIKEIGGRLVERNDEFTIINIKGRIKKMKNETVVSVRLPKAKREKNG